MAIKKSDLYSSLWQSCDDLRGSIDRLPRQTNRHRHFFSPTCKGSWGALDQLKDKTRVLKHGVMQQLLKGRIRLL